MRHRARPERLTGQYRQATTYQQPLREVLGRQPDLKHIGHHEHTTNRLNRPDTRIMVQARTHQITALAILFAHQRHFRQIFIQVHLRSVLNEIRNAEQHENDKFTRRSDISFGPITHPTRQPLMVWDFERSLIVAIRSAIPGKLAGLLDLI
ncbi:hypothetical protein D3C75_244190 [compost metagenome]|jgi:hypothetical protein|nr:hypothetical protein PS647_04000 [Pseudomonas fluorescens]